MQKNVSVGIDEAWEDQRIMAEVDIIGGDLLSIILAVEELRYEAGNGVDGDRAILEERLLLRIKQK